LEHWLGGKVLTLQGHLDEATKFQIFSWVERLVAISTIFIAPVIAVLYFILKAVIFFAAFVLPYALFRMMQEPIMVLNQWVLLGMAASVPVLLIENGLFLLGWLVGVPALYLPQSLHFALWCMYFLYGMHMNRQALRVIGS
jgi:hypothetical protein